jgi:hypothetical protein
MVARLDALEDKGLVSRHPHAEDRRRNLSERRCRPSWPTAPQTSSEGCSHEHRHQRSVPTVDLYRRIGLVATGLPHQTLSRWLAAGAGCETAKPSSAAAARLRGRRERLNGRRQRGRRPAGCGSSVMPALPAGAALGRSCRERASLCIRGCKPACVAGDPRSRLKETQAPK